MIYGGNDNVIGEYKSIVNLRKNIQKSTSSFGFIRREFETNNDRDNKIVNDPKKMKYFNIYGNNGIENANKKIKSMNKSNSMNNIYTLDISCTEKRINFLKSNIFNNDEENRNNNKTIRVNRHLQKNKKNKRANSASKLINKYYNNKNNNEIKSNKELNINIHDNININDILDMKNNSKKFLYKNNGEDNFPIKLDWRDEKLHLLLPQNKNKDILKKSSRQRKFKNLYNADPIIPKQKLGEEFKSNTRNEIEQKTKEHYKNINYARIRK